MKKIIILWHNGWRLANQIGNYINLLAYSIEKWFEIYNPSFFEYEDNFLKLPQINFFWKKIIKKISNRKAKIRIYYILFRIWKLFNGKYINVPEQNFIQDISNDKYILKWDYIYTEWWLFKNQTLVIKHYKEIVDYFKFNDDIENNVNKYLKLFAEYDNTIWVHVRRWDYKTYNWGILYVSDEEVLENLRKFNWILWGNNIFIICSDEKINFSTNELEIRYWLWWIFEDLSLLSKCDYIIWSRSTFWLIAAFLWNIPIYFFWDNFNHIKIESKFNAFENNMFK